MLKKEGKMYPGVYCTAHILFLVIFAALVAAGLFLVGKFARTERQKNAAVLISAAFLLIWIVINRVSVTVVQIKNDPDTYSLLNLIPYTFCGLASLVCSLCALICPKNNPLYNFICYFGFFGGVITLFYPDFLESQTFWDIRSFSGLMHHALMIWLTLLLLKTRRFRPDFRRVWIYPLGYTAVMTLGLFELEALGFPAGAMNISSPLLSSLPILTSWYTIFAVSTAVAVLISLIFSLCGRSRSGNDPRQIQ